MNRKMSRFIAKCSDFWQNDLKAIDKKKKVVYTTH